MPEIARRRKGKVRWSNLYSFSCFGHGLAEATPVQQVGGPGFTRVVFCNESHLHNNRPYRYPNNSLSTTKYNFLTFLPKALFEQFRRVANLYFLLAAALSATSLAPFSAPSVIAPLVFVIGISMLKEAVEDWHRFTQDLNVNSRLVKVHLGNGIFLDKPWKSLSVGDVVKVSKNDYFPSDLLLLSSSYEDGLCYVETMNLDGETNLKVKRCLEATLALDEEAAFTNFKATIRCEDPNPNLYSFVGNFEFQDESYPLGPTQVLLRDSKLRNTEYIYGVVIFTSRDTKVVQNSTRSPSKRSRIERKMDKVIYLLFSILLLISLISAFGSCFYTKLHLPEWWYLRPEEEDPLFNSQKPVSSGVLQFFRALILYGYLIPISLYVSIELVKVLQVLLINKDIEMYDDITCKSVEARTSNLNEELGQVEIILSDKTGTLTCNQMEFRKCSIAGISYGDEVSEVDFAVSKRMNAEFEKFIFTSIVADSTSRSLEMFEFSVNDFAYPIAAPNDEVIKVSSMEYITTPHVEKEAMIKGFNFKDDGLMTQRWTCSSNLLDMIMFFRIMALCHTGIPVENNGCEKLKYEAESPEEVAFLIASQEFGFKFCRRTQCNMVLKELDPYSKAAIERTYKLLHLLEFTSSRRRMSVVVSDEDGNIFLLCKGADSIIFDKLADDGKSYQEATTAHLSDYAEDGLRTLAFAYRRIKREDYDKWSPVFMKAKTTVGPGREELLETASEMIEKDLILVGAVAIEDKLQKGVPNCIDKLAQAGLKIWLLTGDKKETAINIGFACSLLREDMKQFHLSLSKEVESNYHEKAKREDIMLQIQSAYQVTCEDNNIDAPFALVVDGKALEIALRSDTRDQFLRLAVKCASVICCRVSPKQKALVTRSVKDYTGWTTLAIGDGANDVGMIQEADIGVGISGMEGMQAVMASDFSLPQFRFLERLLVVHGHWCYRRISKMILYFVYKNVAFGLTLFLYEVCTNFSGEVIYDDWYMVMFNVVLTSLPVIALGVLEQDVSSYVCLQFPAIYRQGQSNIYFSWTRIIGWILNGVLASLLIFTLNVYALSYTAFQGEGKIADVSHIGATTYSCVIWVVNCQIALITNHFTWIQHILIWGSILFWYICLSVYGLLPPVPSLGQGEYHLFMEGLGTAVAFWLVTLLVVIVSLLPYFLYLVIQRLFYPMDDQVLQEMKHYEKDVTENLMWLREQNNAVRKTHIGFTARVNAKIRYLKRQLLQKKASLI